MIRKIQLLLLLAFLQACVTTDLKTAERMVGQWQSDVGGFRVVVEYTDSTVRVGENEPVGYQLVEDQLTIAGAVSQLRRVSFPSRNLMLQVDPVTGASHEFIRVTP